MRRLTLAYIATEYVWVMLKVLVYKALSLDLSDAESSEDIVVGGWLGLVAWRCGYVLGPFVAWPIFHRERIPIHPALFDLDDGAAVAKVAWAEEGSRFSVQIARRCVVGGTKLEGPAGNLHGLLLTDLAYDMAVDPDEEAEVSR